MAQSPRLCAPHSVHRVIFARLRELCHSGTPEQTVDYLHEYTRLAVVTKDEGKGVVAAPHSAAELWRQAKMRRSKLPPADYLAIVTTAGLPWQWARYVEVGLDLTTFAALTDATDLEQGVSAALTC